MRRIFGWPRDDRAVQEREVVLFGVRNTECGGECATAAQCGAAGVSDGATGGGKPRVALNNPPTSPLNLIGKLEGWGIGPATPVAEVSIKVAAATGAQLKELLKKLPDGMTFELSLEKEDN